MERADAAKDLAWMCFNMFSTTPGIGEHLEALAAGDSISSREAYEALGHLAFRADRLARAVGEGREQALREGALCSIAEAALLITVVKTQGEIEAQYEGACERARLYGF